MVREAGDYFAGGGRLHATLRRLAQRLSSEGIAYALLGGMALGEHGYVRMTEDVDVLLTAEGLARFRERLEGQGYVGTHPGATRSFRDVESGVRIEVLVTPAGSPVMAGRRRCRSPIPRLPQWTSRASGCSPSRASSS